VPAGTERSTESTARVAPKLFVIPERTRSAMGSVGSGVIGVGLGRIGGGADAAPRFRLAECRRTQPAIISVHFSFSQSDLVW
jgi:hypothetical protein